MDLEDEQFKNFNLKRKFEPFNLSFTTAQLASSKQSGFEFAPQLSGLNNADNINLQLVTSIGTIVWSQGYTDPPNILNFSTNMGVSGSIPQVAPGNYLLEAIVSNNCYQNYEYSSNIVLGNFDDYTLLNPEDFIWTFTPKPDFQCPELNYKDNYLAPRDCCEGNL